MGLQDEKLKEGKTVKASLGLLAMKKSKDKGAKGPELLSPVAMAGRFFTKGGKVMKARYGKSVKTNKTNPEIETIKSSFVLNEARAKAIKYAQKNKGEDRLTESDIQMALKTLKGFKNKKDGGVIKANTGVLAKMDKFKKEAQRKIFLEMNKNKLQRSIKLKAGKD